MELNYTRKVGQYALFLTHTVKGSMMYKVIGSVQSRAFRVLWLLREMDLPFAHINAPPQSEEVKKYNPFGKIPILVDGVATQDNRRNRLSPLGGFKVIIRN